MKLNRYLALSFFISLYLGEACYPQVVRDAFNRNKQSVQDRHRIERPIDRADGQFVDEELSLRQRRLRRRLADVPALPLEAPLDATMYIVGPGDQFMINIWSSIEDFIITTVTPESKMIIPTIGSLDVHGRLLSEVQEMVLLAGQEKYLHTRIEANLVGLRSIRIHVAGQVIFPGSYEAYAVNRVSDVIEVTGGLTSWASEREIQLRHRNGAVEMADLYAYHKLGDLSANPFLRGGDVIFVPAIDMNKPSVTVEGMVNDPGSYQIQDGELLMDFLLRVDALSRRTDLEAAYVTRVINDLEERIPIFPYLQSGNGGSHLQLHRGDRVMIPKRAEDVYVVGAVQYPGPYPFIPGMKVRDYVGFGGAMNQAAGVDKARLIMKGKRKGERGAERVVSAGDVVYVPRKTELRVGEVASVIAALATTILTIDSIRRR